MDSLKKLWATSWKQEYSQWLGSFLVKIRDQCFKNKNLKNPLLWSSRALVLTRLGKREFSTPSPSQKKSSNRLLRSSSLNFMQKLRKKQKSKFWTIPRNTFDQKHELATWMCKKHKLFEKPKCRTSAEHNYANEKCSINKMPSKN